MYLLLQSYMDIHKGETVYKRNRFDFGIAFRRNRFDLGIAFSTRSRFDFVDSGRPPPADSSPEGPME